HPVRALRPSTREGHHAGFRGSNRVKRTLDRHLHMRAKAERERSIPPLIDGCDACRFCVSAVKPCAGPKSHRRADGMIPTALKALLTFRQIELDSTETEAAVDLMGFVRRYLDAKRRDAATNFLTQGRQPPVRAEPRLEVRNARAGPSGLDDAE